MTILILEKARKGQPTWKHVVLDTVVLSKLTPQDTNFTVLFTGTRVICVSPEERDRASNVILQDGRWLPIKHLHACSKLRLF